MHGTYEFRKEMLQIHRPDLLDRDYAPKQDEFAITEDWSIIIPAEAGRVLVNAAQDLQDYLFTSLGVSVAVKRRTDLNALPEHTILVATSQQLGIPFAGQDIPASYCVNIQPGKITVCGNDERGCAQGLYQLEDRMNHVRAPYLMPETFTYSPEFSPRMVHSGYQIDRFPDAHLAAIAHAGMDAILAFINGVNMTPSGYMDFNELIYRAEKYGLDVYVYSYFKSNYHPDDPRCREEFESTYGELFRRCPGFKGVVLVGETVEFPSKDPRVSNLKVKSNHIDGIPTGKPTAGWFPCDDYPQWLNTLKDVVRTAKPDADVVFWTYNWGYVREKERLELIDALPTDISLMATFEMFQVREVDGLRMRACDYTASFTQAGDYFRTEGERAKQRGIRLYAQANSAGLTWDFGTIPYEPCPMQWAKRYDAMLEAKDKYGLCGIMESHHYGFWPSFVSRLEKLMFTAPRPGSEAALKLLAEEYYGQALAPKALQAWEKLSDGLHHYVCTNEDQYGPFRIGPAYPLIYRVDVQIPKVPYAHFGGNRICFTDYAGDAVFACTGYGDMRTALVAQRIPDEIQCLEKMETLFREGRAILEELVPELTGVRQEDCLRLCNLVHYMENCTRTTIHTKQWAMLRWAIGVEGSSKKILEMHREMEKIGWAEIANAEATIPLVQADSRLGWEPSMEYIGSEYHLRWKIRQVRQVLEQEIPRYERGIQYMLDTAGQY